MAGLIDKEMRPVAAHRGGNTGLFILPILGSKPTTPISLAGLDQAALYAVVAVDECEGKERKGWLGG